MKIHYPHWTGTDAFGQGTRDTDGRALVEAICLTSEVCGQPLSPAAAEILADDLADFEEPLLLAALARCRLELQTPLRVADILARLEDGRPEGDEAWLMMPQDERTSVVWTQEMARAWGIVQPMLASGDFGAARTAFFAAYAKAVLEARIRREQVRWMPSLGSDLAGRERVLADAVRKGRLASSHAEQLLPSGGSLTGAEPAPDDARIKSLH